MKILLTRVAACFLALAAFSSCEKDEEKATITPSNSLSLTSSTNSIVLAQVNGAQTAVTYTWTPISSFSWSGTESTSRITPAYQLQFSQSADGFGNPGVIAAGAGPTKAVTVSELNSVLIGMGLAPGASKTVYVRVAAVVGTDAQSFSSQPVALTVTPYRVCLAPNSDVWALVGPAGNGWPSGSTASEDGIVLTWDCTQNAYMVRTMLNAGEFKFRLNRGWATNLGGPAGNLAQGVMLAPNGPNLSIATAGTYTVKLTVTGSGASTTAGMVTVTP